MKSYTEHHSYKWRFKNSRLTPKVFAKHAIKKKGESSIVLRQIDLQDMAREDLKVNVSMTKYRWAKKYIMKHF